MARVQWEETGQEVNGHVIEQKVKYRANASADYGDTHWQELEKVKEFRCANCDRKSQSRYIFEEEFPECSF